MARKDKQIVLQLRMRGKTYGEIREVIGSISKSTLSMWFRDIDPDIEELLKGRERARYIAARHRQAEREKHTAKIIKSAKAEFPKMARSNLFLSGLCLYWAEGDKHRQERVKFTNSDERMILLMIRWFREVCGVPEEKFRIALHVHNLHVSKDVKRYWSEITGVPEEQFQKIYIKKTTLQYRKNVLYNGTCAIVVNDKNLFRKILGWKLGLIESFGVSRGVVDGSAGKVDGIGNVLAI